MAKCKRLGCIEKATNKGFCSNHKQSVDEYSRKRLEHHKLYSTAWWKKTRRIILSRQPLCVHCLEHNITTPAIDVDHIIDHKGDTKLFYDIKNLQGLCKRCHADKTNSM